MLSTIRRVTSFMPRINQGLERMNLSTLRLPLLTNGLWRGFPTQSSALHQVTTMELKDQRVLLLIRFDAEGMGEKEVVSIHQSLGEAFATTRLKINTPIAYQDCNISREPFVYPFVFNLGPVAASKYYSILQQRPLEFGKALPSNHFVLNVCGGTASTAISELLKNVNAFVIDFGFDRSGQLDLSLLNGQPMNQQSVSMDFLVTCVKRMSSSDMMKELSQNERFLSFLPTVGADICKRLKGKSR